jgi:hypothetical protein
MFNEIVKEAAQQTYRLVMKVALVVAAVSYLFGAILAAYVWHVRVESNCMEYHSQFENRELICRQILYNEGERIEEVSTKN